jgi:hypothetical protein
MARPPRRPSSRGHEILQRRGRAQAWWARQALGLHLLACPRRIIPEPQEPHLVAGVLARRRDAVREAQRLRLGHLRVRRICGLLRSGVPGAALDP